MLQFVLVLGGHQHLGGTEPSVQVSGRPDLDERVVRFLGYLTIWSNALGAITVGSLAFDPVRDGRLWRAPRLAGLVTEATLGRADSPAGPSPGARSHPAMVAAGSGADNRLQRDVDPRVAGAS